MVVSICSFVQYRYLIFVPEKPYMVYLTLGGQAIAYARTTQYHNIRIVLGNDIDQNYKDLQTMLANEL